MSKKQPTLTERFYAKEELTAEERKSISAGPVRINSVRCKKCSDIIVSNNRHDWKQCKCENIFVGGGSWYTKRVFRDGPDSYEELSVMYQDQEQNELAEIT